MGVDLARSTWLADLVDRELEGYDPATARMRLPRDVREADPEGPDLEARARMLVVRSLRRNPAGPAREGNEAFLAPVEGHLDLLLDLALLLEVPFEPAQRKADLAAVLAAGTGELSTALKSVPGPGRRPPAEGYVRRALARAGEALLRLHHPPGDPEGGLPLYAGTVAVERRVFARIALAFFQTGTLDADHAVAQGDQAQEELVLLVESLAGLLSVEGPLPLRRRHVVQRQIERLGLDRERARAARARAAAPRPPEEICAAAPPRFRAFLLEQLLLASLGLPGSTAHGEFVARFAAAAEIPPERLVSLQAEAAAFHADHRAWFHAFGLPQEPEWSELAEEWNDFGERMMDRVAAVVAQNMDAIVTEVRETGELGSLLAKAAAGQALDAGERRKVKEQLIDLAKAVPALAIFAAPGGLVLLPLLAKLLPFDILPSAFQSGKGHPEAGRSRAARGAGPAKGAKGDPPESE